MSKLKHHDYNAKLHEDYEDIKRRVETGMLPLVARIPAIEKASSEYAIAQAEYHTTLRNTPIRFGEDYALERFADLIILEELTWSHADKMSIVEYPVLSDNQESLRRGKYTPNSDLQYGDRRYQGRRKTHFTDKYGAPQVRNPRIAVPIDSDIDTVGEHDELYDALDNAGLTARQRQAINLVYFGNEGDGMTQEDAGEVMGVSQPAVIQFINAGMAKIKRKLV